MCATCGCSVTPDNGQRGEADTRTIAVLQDLLLANDQQAAHNRAHFDGQQVLAVNLMSSPGAGKTRLLEWTIEQLGGDYRLAVIEGDLATENDAMRIRARGVPAIQINTGTACHLDAHQIHRALHELDLAGLDILFIENVGNLVCPASFDLGQHHNVTLLAVTEGDDKPAKYPVMFRAADAVLLTKADLLPVLDDFDAARAQRYLRDLATPAPFLTLSARRDPASLTVWLDWLRTELAAQRGRLAQGSTARPALQPDGARLHGGQSGHHHGADGTVHHHDHGHHDHHHHRGHHHDHESGREHAHAHPHTHAHPEHQPLG